MSTAELVANRVAHQRRFNDLQEIVGRLIADAWLAYADLGNTGADMFTAAAATIVDGTRAQTASAAQAYMAQNDAILEMPPTLRLVTPTIRGDVPTAEVYRRSIIQARTMVSRGASFADAMAGGQARAVATAKTDVSLMNRATMSAGAARRPWVVGYRRTLTGKSCAFCAVASTQRYRSAELLPLHPSCDCGIAEIFGTADPGRVVNRELLDGLKAEGIVDDISARRRLPDARAAVDAQRERIERLKADIRAERDQERETRLEKRLDKAQRDLVTKQERVAQLERTNVRTGSANFSVDADGTILGTDGKPVRAKVQTHPELGPTLLAA